MNHIIRRQLIPKITRRMSTATNKMSKSDTDKIVEAINANTKEIRSSSGYIQLAIVCLQGTILVKSFYKKT